MRYAWENDPFYTRHEHDECGAEIEAIDALIKAYELARVSVRTLELNVAVFDSSLETPNFEDALSQLRAMKSQREYRVSNANWPVMA